MGCPRDAGPLTAPREHGPAQPRPAKHDAERIGLALEAAGLSAYLLEHGGPAPSMFPEVRIAWDGEAGGGFRLESGEEVELPAVSEGAAMEMQLEARALARKWGATWAGGISPAGVRVAFTARSPLAPGDSPLAAGALLHETAARLHVAHLLLRQRAIHIAWAHAGKGAWAHERMER